jgi:hypothetical protein
MIAIFTETQTTGVLLTSHAASASLEKQQGKSYRVLRMFTKRGSGASRKKNAPVVWHRGRQYGRAPLDLHSDRVESAKDLD